MSKTIDFYYDYGSPTTYLAWTQIFDLAEKHGATVVRKPALLGGIFKNTGNQTPAAVPAKGKYMFVEMQRYAKRYGVPMRFNDNFPINTIYLMRGALHARREGFLPAYDKVCFESMWVNNLNMGDPEVMAKVFTDAGFDANSIGAAMQDPSIKKELFDLTEQATAAGLFGMPAFIIDGEMYWGQDRLDFVEEALLK